MEKIICLPSLKFRDRIQFSFPPPFMDGNLVSLLDQKFLWFACQQYDFSGKTKIKKSQRPVWICFGKINFLSSIPFCNGVLMRSPDVFRLFNPSSPVIAIRLGWQWFVLPSSPPPSPSSARHNPAFCFGLLGAAVAYSSSCFNSAQAMVLAHHAEVLGMTPWGVLTSWRLEI